MSLTAATLLLPQPDSAWRAWHPKSATAGEAIENPANYTHSHQSVVVGLPASACRSIGLLLPLADSDILAQMVETQLERHGLRTPNGQLRPHRWHLLGQSGGLAIISVDVLAEPFPEHLTVGKANDYAAALRLLDLPENQLVIVEEHGEWVIAASFHGRLFRSHVFAPRGSDLEDVAHEIFITRLSLESHPSFGTLTGITLVGSDWDVATLGAKVDLPVKRVDYLPRRSQMDTAVSPPLLPTAVREAKLAVIRRRRILRYGSLAALLYVSVAFLALAYLRFHEEKVVRLEESTNASAAPAAAVQKAAEAWKSLAPALDPNRYPMVLMAAINELMPPSGIVIRQFSAKTDELDLRGEARDPQVAYQFLEDIQKHKVLSRYSWSMPQPSVREKTASFRMQGKLK